MNIEELPAYCDSYSKEKDSSLKRAKEINIKISKAISSFKSPEIAQMKTKFKNYKVIELQGNDVFSDFVRAYDLFGNYLFCGVDATIYGKLKNIMLYFDDLRKTHELIKELNTINFSQSKYYLEKLFEPYHDSYLVFVKLFKEVMETSKSSNSDGIGMADIIAKMNT